MITDVPDDDSAAKKGLVVQKRQIRPRKLQKTMLVSELYGITKSIAKTDGVAGLVARDLLRVAPSGHSPSSHGPLIEEELLSQDQDPSICQIFDAPPHFRLSMWLRTWTLEKKTILIYASGGGGGRLKKVVSSFTHIGLYN